MAKITPIIAPVLESEFVLRMGKNYRTKDELPSSNFIVIVDGNIRNELTTNYKVFDPSVPNNVISAERHFIRHFQLNELVGMGKWIILDFKDVAKNGKLDHCDVYPVLTSTSELTEEFFKALPSYLIRDNKVAYCILDQSTGGLTSHLADVSTPVKKPVESENNIGECRYEERLTKYVYALAKQTCYVTTQMFGHQYFRPMNNEDRVSAIKQEIEKYEQETGRTAFLARIPGQDTPVVVSKAAVQNPLRFNQWLQILVS